VEKKRGATRGTLRWSPERDVSRLPGPGSGPGSNREQLDHVLGTMLPLPLRARATYK
jgi:hypothetical protein